VRVLQGRARHPAGQPGREQLDRRYVQRREQHPARQGDAADSGGRRLAGAVQRGARTEQRDQRGHGDQGEYGDGPSGGGAPRGTGHRTGQVPESN
jgi:hypothetical protein